MLRSLEYVDYSRTDLSSLRLSAPLALFFVAMLLTGFMSMQFLSVPMIMVFKNTTNVLIVSGEWYLYGQEASVGVRIADRLAPTA